MNTHAAVMERVRAADPLSDSDLNAWADAPTTRALVDRIAATGVPDTTASPSRRRTTTVVAAVVGASVAGVGVAVASGVFGSPAPDSVRKHLAELDRGMPADLRYDPDVTHARAVAVAGPATLYFADLADGGYCIEVSTDAMPRGASCVPAADVSGMPLDVTAPIPPTDGAPLIVGGRTNNDAITTVEVRYADGGRDLVPFGDERTWLLVVPDAHRASALDDGVVIAGLDDTRETVASIAVPPLRDEDPTGTAHDANTPFTLMTTSDGDDLTLILGINGRVNIPGDVRLHAVFPDGSRIGVPVDSDGHYRLMLSPDRRDDFATTPGHLVANVDGERVASRPIASVAWWRAHAG